MEKYEKARLLKLKTINSKGKMNVLENGDGLLPFDIKRLFFMYGINKNDIRGNHSNKKSKFLFIPLNGHLSVDVIYPDGTTETFILDQPSKALYIPQGLWKIMYNYSNDCILLVLSNEIYDKNEYIYDLNKYLDKNREDNI